MTNEALRRELTTQFLIDRNLRVSQNNIDSLVETNLEWELRRIFRWFGCDKIPKTNRERGIFYG